MKKIIFLLLLISSQVALAQNWNLVWSDEFNGSISPDWNFDIGSPNNGWGNDEQQYYRRENATIENGNLVITAKNESYGGKNYTSARMSTGGKKSFTYGKIECRMAMPSFNGSWPAFWMLGDNIGSVGWPSCGEIDIMEHINTEPTIFQTIHWKDANGQYAKYTSNATVDVTPFHTYSVEWDDQTIKWFIDGSQYQVASIANNVNGTTAFHKSFYLLLNLSIGGMLPGYNIDNGAMPARMLVDYVRVYQNNGVVPSTTGLVTAFGDCSYGANSGGLNVGDYNIAALNALGLTNKTISSLRITQGYKAVLFDGDNFTGNSIEITSDNNCLGAWNDATSSMKVLPNGISGMNGTYFLQNRNSGLFMDVTGGLGAKGDGALIQQYHPTNAANQQFAFTDLGNGCYKVISVNSGKSLDVQNVSLADGAALQQWTDYTAANQQFIVVSTGDGYFKLIPKHSGKVVEVAGAATNIEVRVQQWQNNNQTCGQWKFVSNTVTGLDVKTSVSAEAEVYPNPVSNELHIKSGSMSISGYAITDIKGQDIRIGHQLCTGECLVHIADLPSGFYFLKIFSEGKLIGMKKIAVN
jgi:beta-glucanase (GH16 family)